MRINLQQTLLASVFVAVGAIGAGGAIAAGTDAPAPSPMPGTVVPADAIPRPPAGNHSHMAGLQPDTRTMAARVEQRIADLHNSLHVTAAQQPQWDAFAAVMRNNAQQMDGTLVADAGLLSKMTAVDQMRAYAKIADQHAKDVDSLLPAFQGLYDVMPPEQKLNADNYFRAQAERSRHGKKA